MKVTDMTVEVKAQLIVDKETAETCLKMVELYCNQTSSLIIANRGIDGTMRLNFEDPKPYDAKGE